MKSREIEVKVATRTEYSCDFCGKKSAIEHDIRRCEKAHKQEACNHDEVVYKVNAWLFIEKRCKDCDKELGWIDLSHLDSVGQDKLCRVYDVLVDVEPSNKER